MNEDFSAVEFAVKGTPFSLYKNSKSESEPGRS